MLLARLLRSPKKVIWNSWGKGTDETQVDAVVVPAVACMFSNAVHLNQLEIPVLLIHPDSSPFLPVSMSAEIHSLLPNSQLMVIPHAKHAIACSHANEGVAAFLNFIDSHV